MGCVNTNSKEFKDTAKRLNVHPSALEGVVHEFINTKGNEDSFPSDDYIQKRLKGEAVKISAEDLELCTLKGWRNTQYFGNYNAMINQMTEMQKFLPEGMVIGGRDHDGNYTISLAPLVLDGVKLTPIRQEYQGKLIYSQSKSGKSTIADGKTVIDLDVDSNIGRKDFSRGLTEKMKEALEEGKTLLTSDRTLLNEADVIVYTSNPNDIVARTEETVPFDSPESYKGEIDSINETINNRRGGVEVIKLSGKDDVLGKHILSDPNYKQTTKGKETTYSTEEKKILKSAPRNAEGKLLAPNGEVSNLTEKQYAQVRTKAFKDWFGDWENNPKEASKVVDENGEPLVVYHGGAPGISVFHPSSESESTTGYGFYTDKKTGEKIPIDSNRTMFFSSNKYVGKSYATFHGIGVLKALSFRVDSLIRTLYEGKLSLSLDFFKSIDDFFNTLESLAEYNPRFAKVKRYIQENRKVGKHATEKEVKAIREMLKEVKKQLIPYFQMSHLMNRSSWENIQEKIKKIITTYNTPDGIKRLKQGEIPIEIKKEYDLYKKIQAQIVKEGRPLDNHYDEITLFPGPYSNNSIYIVYDGNALKFIRYNNIMDVTSMSENQIKSALEDLNLANENSSRKLKEEENYNKVLSNSELYPVFLNIKDPLKHDYEGTEQGAGYKHSQKNSFGYVAARQVNKAINEGHDGVIYENLYDPYLADNYGVFNPNQIKSATENTGEFSTLDNDIYADGLFSPGNFDRETPAPKSLKRKRMQEEWKAKWDAIKSNDWNLPKEIQEKVEKKLKEYDESQYGYYKGEVDTTNYFGKENKTTAKSVLEYIAKNSTDSTTRKLASRLLKNLGNNGEVPVTFGFAYGARGIYNAAEHSVAISTDALKGKTLEEALVSMEGTIIHEIAHAITVNTMIEDSTSTKDLAVIYKEYKELGTKYGLNLGYGAKNQKEFVAEFLGNKFFREVLMALPSNTNKKVSIGRKILNFILEKVFGITPKDTFYHRADKVIQQLLDRANSRETTEINNTETYAQEDLEKKFTFNDGTTVDAPFKPNAQQTTVLNAMDDFIKSDKNIMTLSGYAGTGKTSLMEMVAKKCRQEGKDVIFCASTNKAAAVLNDKVSRSHFEAKTLHKIFGITVSPNLDTKHYDAKQLQAALKSQDELIEGSTVIIDESSMINQWEYDVIKGKAEKANCKIIFVGDEAQLAPVNEDKTSVVFRQNDGKVERLTQVERTGDNAILKEATAIRDGKALSGKTSFNDKGEGVAYITPQNAKAIDAVINAFIPGLQNDSNHFRILAYTNAAVANYNDRVRRALGYTGTIPRVGEPMMGYDNWGWDRTTKSYNLVNSESYKVTKIEETETVSREVGEGKDSKEVEFQVTYITLENPLGEEVTVPFIDIKGNAHNRESAEILGKELKALQQELNELQKNNKNTKDDSAKIKKAKAALLKKIGNLREFLFVNDNIMDGNSGRALVSKVIDFGYAMTVHKSQGSTFKNVLLDDANIKDSKATSEEKQQLEYVGVSRATDTVTVISNNVKKEGTPMQYNKSISTTNTRTQESPERKVIIPPTIDGKVQPKETFSIKVDNGIHIYNSRGEEVFNRGTAEDTRNRNKVIANYRVQEGSAVKVPLIDAEGKQVITKKGISEEVVVYKDGTMISIKASPGEELFATAKTKTLSNYQATLRLAEQKFAEKDPSKIPSTVYHYSDSEISKFTNQEDNYFSRVKGGTKNAIFFTDNPNPSKGTVLDRANKYAVSLNVAPDKVKVVYGTKEDMHARGTTFTEEVNKAEKEGYEAVRFVGINDNQETNQNITVIFDPSKANIQGKEDRNITWARTSDNGYEVSSKGDSRFSALNATFKDGTIIEGTDVGGKTIEYVYQHVIKKSGKGKAPSPDSVVYKEGLSKEAQEDYSYTRGYLPLWQEWAKQNPELIRDLKEKAQGKVLTDQFATTRVSQARALADIINNVDKNIEAITPSFKGKMTYAFNGESRQGVKSATTIEAIKNGERTATTRYSSDGNINYWKNAKKGDIIEFTGANGETALVEVTVPLHKLDANTTASEWSKKEGWNEDRFNNKVKPRIDRGEAYQMEFRYVGSKDKESSAPIDTRTQEGLDKAKKDHKQLVVNMGNDANATQGIRTAIAGAKKGITLKDALGSHSPFFTQEEIDQIEASILSRKITYYGNTITGRLEIMSVSRRTDPIFFADDIVKFLKENGKKPLNDPTRTVAMEIWSKHDGLPLRRIMEACKKYRVAPMLSFSITGLGGTALEKGVMKYNDMLDKIETLINEGIIDPTTTTIRIDPILVGETKLEDIKAIVERAKGMGIKKFVTSLVQSYGYTEGTSNDRHVVSGINDSLATEGRKYDWDKYYGRDKNGKINFKPKQEYIDEVAKFLVELNTDPNIEIQSCAFAIKGLKTSACLDPYIIQSVTGISIMDSYIKDEARPGCDCYGVHQDFFKNDKTCNSSCAYCYAKHSGDNNMRYYDNNGKLIDNVYTRTSESQSTSQTSQTPQENKPKQDKSITKKENKNFMEKSSRISTMRNNLNNSSLLKASEVRKIGEKVVDWISDYITSLQQNPEEIARVYGESFKDIDVSSMSRAELVNKIGIENIFLAAKDKFDSEQHEDWIDDVASKADELYDNFDALIYMAHDRFAENEGFSISLSTDGNKYEVNTEVNDDADNFNASNKESDTSEIEKDLQEHWQVETKTRDVIDSMNKLVKDTLRQCLVLDSKGEPVRDEFGFNERVDIREAVNYIYNTTKGSLTLGDMISKLKEKVEEYPWLTQLLEKLEDTTGEYNDLQSQFFGDMFKPFQSYHVVIKEGGKFKSIPVNENPVLQESLNSVKSLYYMGEHPLFIQNKGELNHKTFEKLKGFTKELQGYIDNKDIDVTDSNTKGKVAEVIANISQCLGFPVTPEIVATGLTKESLIVSNNALNNIITALEKFDTLAEEERRKYDAFSFKNDISIRGNLKTFLSPIVQHFEDIAMASTYDDGKMYQSYVTPSYLSKLMIKFATTDEAAFKDFIQSEYGQYSWFWDSANNSWNNDWLEQLDKDPEARKIFKHKVQLNFDGKHYMKGMSDAEYALSVFTEYFGDGGTGKAKTPAWFRIPMQSNKPSSEFIQFYSDRSTFYKDNLTNKLFKVFCQELSRIQTVTERNLSKSDKGFIANFDKNGNKFHFLEYMNKYLDTKAHLEGDAATLRSLLLEAINGKKNHEELGNFADLVKKAIRSEMDAKVTSIVDGMYESGIAQAAVDNLPGFSKEVAREKLENFVWNDTFAAINILQLTVTDIAFYKNAEDLQKRLAEIHAPGIRGRVDATDYTGKKVSDGKYRAIKLADFDKVTSNIIENLTIVFDRRIANAKTETERKGYEVLKESLVGEKGLYRDINVTDAQAYNCPTSYRKKAIMFGKWSKDAEKVWETLASGKANLSDIKVAFQPLKPTVFSHAIKNVGTENSTMNNLKVPIYYKNSEYLLIMADAILRGENTGKPNLLRALFDVMEESHFTIDKKSGEKVYKTDGIDTIIFESGVKSGLGGQVSLSDLVYSANGEALAKERLEAAIYNSDGRYNTDTVDVMAFEDYCLQQEVPEHFKDHAQVFGSQLRYIGISELESIDASGEAVKYHIGKDVEGKTAQELKEEYENLIAQNIQESMDELYEELCVGEEYSLKEKNAALSKILQREILASPRYGIDLLQACSINENGEFNIPLGDPIQSKRVQQLINSIVKNRINKQKIAGGPVVQVTSFGTSTELGIKFKDGKGGLLLTRKEWENSSSKEHATYDDYIKENQKGIAYMEVLAPAYASDILRKFTGSDGVVNVKALEMLDPELLEMIGYRIPTEEKYSAAPLKIVGFLPREAGEGIMLPYDITLINGSDYDVDKEYIMRKVLNIKVKPEYANKEGNINKTKMHQIIWNDLIKSQAKEGKEKNLGYHQKTQLSELVDLFLNDPFNEAALTAPVNSKDQISMTKGAYNRMLRTYLNAYEVEHPGLDTKEGRDNRIIDILNSVLTHETSTENVLNPGGFEEQKKMGYLVEAIRNNPELTSTYTWEELENMSIDELKELSSKDKNLCYINTQFQFYKQNSAAGSLIGIFAVNRTAHAAIESGSIDGSATYFIDGRQLEEKDGFENVSIDGISLGTKNNYEVRFDMRRDTNGMPIGKTLGSLVGASADAVKDPVLNLMNINSDTANVLNALLRVGIPFRTAALFLSQGSISSLISKLNMQRLSDGYGSLSDIAVKRFEKLKEQYKLSQGDINSEDLSIEDLIDGIKGPKNSTDAEQNKQAAIEYKVLKTLIRSLNIADALRLPTFATRFNSVTSAVGPLVIDNLITEMQGKDLNDNSLIRIKDSDGKDRQVKVGDILDSHPILNGFAHGLNVARNLFGTNSPLNSTNFRDVLDWVSGNFPSLKAALISSSGRTLFNTLGNIYQTMLLYNTGVLKSEELGYFIKKFPEEFMKKDYKNDERFKDNELIKMIRYTNVKGNNKRVALSINTTSLDTAHKEKLSNALIDLYKTDQEGAELAIKLFKYNVFKGGIDFSPKTFTHLFPSFIKERIPGETSESGYIDTFRKLPELEPATVIDMLVRNNYDNNRLAPVFKDKAIEAEKASKNNDTEAEVSGPRILDGVLERFSDGNKQVTLNLEEGQGKSLIYTPYFKMYDKEGNIRLFSTDVNVDNIGRPESVTVTEISKLGNGKEYMELYNETNHEAMSQEESSIIEESPNDITLTQDGSMDTMLNHSVEGRKISTAELMQEALKYSDTVNAKARNEGVSVEQKAKDEYIRMGTQAEKSHKEGNHIQVEQLLDFVKDKLKDKGFDIDDAKFMEDIENFKEKNNLC